MVEIEAVRVKLAIARRDERARPVGRAGLIQGFVDRRTGADQEGPDDGNLVFLKLFFQKLLRMKHFHDAVRVGFTQSVADGPDLNHIGFWLKLLIPV